jgi:nicotinamidase-related amidase
MPATLDQATALVLIDLQHGITAQPTVHPSEQIVARCARLAIVFRANGKLIAATRVAFGQDPASRDSCTLLSVPGPGHAAGPADPGQRRMGHGGRE